MADLNLDSESARNNAEFLFSAAKRFIALGDRLNTASAGNTELSSEIFKEMGAIAAKAEAIDAFGAIGIVSKLVIGADSCGHQSQMDSSALYDRVESQAVLSAIRFIKSQSEFSALAAEKMIQQTDSALR